MFLAANRKMALGKIEFHVNKQKVIEALVYLATQRPRIDIFHVCKVLFYADLAHLRRYGRPILGDRYVAMDDGPVPSFTLDLAKRKAAFAGAEWVAKFNRRVTVDESDGYVRLIARSDFSDRLFSRTDLERLDAAISVYADMPGVQLWRAVHKEPAYKAVYRDGTSTTIPIEAMIPESTPNRDSILEHLRETAHITDV